MSNCTSRFMIRGFPLLAISSNASRVNYVLNKAESIWAKHKETK